MSNKFRRVEPARKRFEQDQLDEVKRELKAIEREDLVQTIQNDIDSRGIAAVLADIVLRSFPYEKAP